MNNDCIWCSISCKETRRLYESIQGLIQLASSTMKWFIDLYCYCAFTAGDFATLRSSQSNDGFSLDIKATGSCSSAQKPASESRPLYAGRRPPSLQAPGGLVPEVETASGFDDAIGLNDASSMGSLSFVSRTLTCSRFSLSFCSNAHHYGSLPQQLGVI